MNDFVKYLRKNGFNNADNYKLDAMQLLLMLFSIYGKNDKICLMMKELKKLHKDNERISDMSKYNQEMQSLITGKNNPINITTILIMLLLNNMPNINNKKIEKRINMTHQRSEGFNNGKSSNEDD